MNSRISIDVNEDNQPVIMIDYVDSGDVRDKLVRRFMQGFGGESNVARVEFIQHPSSPPNVKMVITPISEVEIELHESLNEGESERITKVIEKF